MPPLFACIATFAKYTVLVLFRDTVPVLFRDIIPIWGHRLLYPSGTSDPMTSPPWLTSLFTSGILPSSGWVRRGGAFRTPSGPKGSSGKEVSPGAAGLPARTIYLHYNAPMFLPTTFEEVKHLGWDALDVILVTGDSCIDSPFFGGAVIGKVQHLPGFIFC